MTTARACALAVVAGFAFGFIIPLAPFIYRCVSS